MRAATSSAVPCDEKSQNGAFRLRESVVAEELGFLFYHHAHPPARPRWRISRCAMRARSTGKARHLARVLFSTPMKRSTTLGTTTPGTSKEP